MFKRWLNKHKEQRKQIRYRQGYDYAAGELLRNPTLQTILMLAGQVASAKDFDEYDEFDKGIEDALDKFDKLQVNSKPYKAT